MTEPENPAHPLAAGQQVQLDITDIAFGGEGVARIGEFVVFVPFVIVGERVEAEVIEVRKKFARARLLRVVQASADRVLPECRYYGECGGCQYQHLAYDAQVKVKHKQIADLFQRIGGFPDAVVDAVIPCPTPYGYRNRIMVRSQWDKFKQGLNIGFIRHDNRLVVDLDECRIAEPVLNEQLRGVRAHPPPKGGIKVTLRLAPDDWEVPPDSFFQNNFHLLPGFVAAVRERVRDAGTRHLVDAYCGVGFFSIELADLVESFVGVEYDTQAIKAARRNAAKRNRLNGEYVTGQTEELLPSLLQRFDPRLTSLILDPPRKGCDPKMLQVLAELRPAQVVYVSCHPATLARDLNLLCRTGVYELKRVTPLDMFPQTQHVECVADVRLATVPTNVDTKVQHG